MFRIHAESSAGPKWADICRTIVTPNLKGEIKWFKSGDNGVSWQQLDEDYYKYIGFIALNNS